MGGGGAPIRKKGRMEALQVDRQGGGWRRGSEDI